MLFPDFLEHSDDVIAQTSGEQMVLFHMASGNYFSLNELGSRIWELCDGSRTAENLVSILEAEYEAPRDLIAEDAGSLIAGLMAKDLLTVGSGNHAGPA